MKGIFRYGNVLTKLLSSLNLTSAAHWKDEHEWHILWKRRGGERRSYFPTTFPLKLRDSDPVSDQGPTDVLNPQRSILQLKMKCRYHPFCLFGKSVLQRQELYYMGSVCVCVSMWISFHKMLTKEGGQAGQSLSSCQFFTNIAIYILHLIQLVLFTRMPVYVFLLSILIYVKISAVTLFQLVYLNLVQPTFYLFLTLLSLVGMSKLC